MGVENTMMLANPVGVETAEVGSHNLLKTLLIACGTGG
jgi:hypothetical protein